MLRITRQTDYGLILLSRMVGQPGRLFTSTELATDAGVPGPMASKILKALAREGVLESQRGASGGYNLARPADRISVAEIIVALEGPIALTECIALGPGECDREPVCPTHTNWRRINTAIRDALASVTLSEMCRPAHRATIELSEVAAAPGARGAQNTHRSDGRPH